MSTPEEMYERLLNVYVLNGQDRRYYRAEFRRALLEHEMRVIEEAMYAENSGEVIYGGSDGGESDCPREPGSATRVPVAPYRRLEGLSAGAWLQDWRLP